MRIPKRYGHSKNDNCPFCGKQAITSNPQGVPVCLSHKSEYLSDLKCQCGDWLDVRVGKFGPYFFCFKCGNINFSRGMEINEGRIKTSTEAKTSPEKKKENSNKKVPQKVSDSNNSFPKKKERKEIEITSDRIDAYFS